MDPIYDIYIYHTLEGVEPPKCLSKLVGIQNWDDNKPVLRRKSSETRKPTPKNMLAKDFLGIAMDGS